MTYEKSYSKLYKCHFLERFLSPTPHTHNTHMHVVGIYIHRLLTYVHITVSFLANNRITQSSWRPFSMRNALWIILKQGNPTVISSCSKTGLNLTRIVQKSCSPLRHFFYASVFSTAARFGHDFSARPAKRLGPKWIFGSKLYCMHLCI